MGIVWLIAFVWFHSSCFSFCYALIPLVTDFVISALLLILFGRDVADVCFFFFLSALCITIFPLLVCCLF